MGFAYNTWGNSWKTSWANSWGLGSIPPTPTRDTHDAWIPDHIVRKFYENERLKQKTVIKAYKKIIEAEPENEEIKEIVSEFIPDTSVITKAQLKEIAEDKQALGRLLVAIDGVEMRILQYKKILEDDNLLIMIAASL